jgi:peptidoglycan/LPS O-acetylase OafA/YrhL
MVAPLRGTMSPKPNAACSIEIPKIPESNSGPSIRLRLDALTSLRFFAALHVVLFHLRVTRILDGGPWWYQNFASIGYVGVNFFFVLSGFILVYTYAGPSLEARKFWQARFARIYPAYIVSLIVSAPFFFFAVRHLNLPFFAWSKDHLVLASILTVCLLQSWLPQAALTWNSVCWSLSVEAFFYAVFPFALRHVTSISQRRLLVGIAGFSFLSLSFSLAYLLLHPDRADKISSGATDLFWKNILSFNPVVRLPEFLVGMCAGSLFLSTKNHRRCAAHLVAAGLVILATLTLLAGRVPSPLISAGFLSPAFAAVIYGIALQPRWASFLASRFLVLLGDASYSLYLLHSIVISRAFDAMPYLPPRIRVAASLAAAIGAALLCYELIEQPARKLLRPRKTN